MTAQDPMKLERADYVIGENIVSGREILANAYILPEKIYDFYVDTISSNVYVELRKWKNTGTLASSGALHAFDENTMTGKWQRRVRYSSGSVVYDRVGYVENIIMQKGKRKYDVLDPATGNTKYEFNRDLQYIFPDLNLGLGYITLLDFPHTLEGFELSSGRILWRRMIPRNRNWNELIIENDSIILISSKGLHSMDLRTGIGWSNEVETNPRYINSNLALNITAGLLLGIITGIYIIPLPTGRANLPINDSKILLDESRYYVASNQSITALDKQGNELWSTPLPIRMISRTQFFKIGKDVISFNFNSDELQNDSRKSFIASYDAETGIPNYITFLRKDSPRAYILDFELIGNYIGLLYPDKIETVDLQSGKTVFAKFLDDMKFLYYVKEYVFVQNDSMMIPLIHKNASHKFIYTENNSIVEYNGLYEKQHEYTEDEFYVLLLGFPGGCVVQNSKETIVLDENNVKISRLDFHENFSVVNDQLYFFDKNRFFSIQLLELLEN